MLTYNSKKKDAVLAEVHPDVIPWVAHTYANIPPLRYVISNISFLTPLIPTIIRYFQESDYYQCEKSPDKQPCVSKDTLEQIMLMRGKKGDF